MNTKFIDNSQLVLSALHSQVEKALEQCGLIAEGYAKRKCPVDTGALRNSITHTVEMGEQKAYVGTNMEYAPYVELGTGVHATEGGRQTPWVYQDDQGKFHTTSGQVPRPFIKPSVADHIEEYKRIIETELKTD